MGYVDNAIDKAAPKGSSIAKPLMKVFIAALASGALKRKQAPAAAPQPSPATDQNADGLLAGMSGLLEKLQQGGHGEAAKSWVGNGQNKEDLVYCTRLDTRTIGHQRSGRKARQVGGGSDDATVTTSARSRRQTDAAWPSSDPGRSREVISKNARATIQDLRD